jgi:hypothetical protein
MRCPSGHRTSVRVAAKSLALLAVQRGKTVFYREAHVLIDDIHQARELGEIKKYRATLRAADLIVRRRTQSRRRRTFLWQVDCGLCCNAPERALIRQQWITPTLNLNRHLISCVRHRTYSLILL